MLALIPLLAFVGLFLVLLRFSPADWRLAFLRAAAAWGVYLVLVTELLSLLRLVTRAGLALAWLLPCLACGIWLRRARGPAPPSRAGGPGPAGFRRALRGLLPPAWPDRLLLLGLLAVLGITATAAWFSPPQTWDSLNYHLSRVAHWAQERAVVHYATGVDFQNAIPPGCEMIMLQFYVLLQSDRLVTFVGWLAMLSSLIAVSRIARSLGCGLRGQLLAAVFLASLPMGIIQASSTISDYVAAAWVVCAAVEAADVLVEGPAAPRLVFAGLAAGLALLTKPTAFPFLLPLSLLLAVVLVKRLGALRALGWGALAAALVLALNAGSLTRNLRTFGNPIGSQAQIGQHRNQLPDLRGTASILIRSVGMHLGTPWDYPNKALGVAVQQMHVWLGLDPNDPRTTSVGVFRVHGITTAEDVAGNPMQAYFVLLSIPLLVLGRKRLDRPTLVYAAVVLSSALVFSWLFKWQTFGGRYHMPFFVLFAPAAGRLLSAFAPGRWGAALGAVYLLAAWPWLFSIESRPLVPVRDRSLVGSILSEPRQRLYFANAPYLIDIYTSLVGTVEEAGCSRVGIALGGNSPEYLLWVLLDAPRPDLRVEWFVSGGPSDLPIDPDFVPCAVICQRCEGPQFLGLPLAYSRDVYQVFMAEPVP
jgi:hypothetical protein